ncbi:transglutaminase domain-containing protein [Candidatus Dojkabacteria bacterium]|nr:transglutaminase domain-containing protein [Candidatus Dojkabacteria bacterium]
MKRLKVLTSIAGILLIAIVTIFAANVLPVYAAGFSVVQHTEYTVYEDYVLIRKTTTISNNSKTQYISGSETQSLNIDFFSDSTTEERDLTLDSLKTSDSDFVLTSSDNVTKVSMAFELDLNPGEKKIFWIEYKDYQLINSIGAITNFYIPKQQIPENNNSYDFSRTFRVNISKVYTSEIFTQVEPVSRSETAEFWILDYIADQLYSSSIHIQIGDLQLYQFNITLSVPQTHEKNIFKGISKNEVTIALPRDYDETGQIVYIESFYPEPKIVFSDELGNTFATFLLDADQAYDIYINGYMGIQFGEKVIPDNALFSDIPDEYSVYLGEASFWEVNSTAVKTAVSNIEKSENIIEVVNNTYTYVVDLLDYDNEKYLNNNRVGAAAAISGEPSVCMEYADTMVALLRAQGVPAVAAYGRGFNPDVPAAEQDNHQWVLAYIPDYGWLTIDPTWGEEGRTYIGPDLDRVLWYISGMDPQTPAPVSHRSSDLFQMSNPVISFVPVESIDLVNTKPLSSFIEPRKESLLTDILTRIQLSIFPRIFDSYFVLFAFAGAILLASFFVSIVKLVVTITKKFSSNPTTVPNENSNRSVLVQPTQTENSPEA